jgi:GT2 family glycosyltransferase
LEGSFSAIVHGRYQEAHSLLKGKRPHLALDILRSLTAENPTFAPAHNDLGLLYNDAGNYSASLFHLRQAWELTNHPVALENYGAVLRGTGNPEEAVRILSQAEREGNLNLTGYPLLVGCLYDTKKLIELPYFLERWIEKDPTDATPRLRLLELPAMLTQILKGELVNQRQEIEEIITAISPVYTEVKKGPFLTVGIPTRNRTDPLYVMLSSLARQTYRNFEVLISDDSTKPGLESEVRRIFPDLNIRYVKGPQKNLPSNRACILEHATGELVVMCDDDHYMVPDCLELLVDSMLQNPRAGIISAVWPHPFENPKVIEFEKVKEQEEYRLDISNVGNPKEFWWKHACELFKSYIKDWPLLKSEIAGGGCLIYRKSAVLSVGGFPTDCSFVSFREDTDISHRVFLSGYDVMVQTAAIAYHLRATDGGCRDEQEWGEKLVRDGVKFLDKLKSWRRAKEEREVLSRSGKLKVGLFTESLSQNWLKKIEVSRNLEVAPDKLGAAFELTGPGLRMDQHNRVLVDIDASNEDLAVQELHSQKAVAIITSNEKLFYKHAQDLGWFYLPELPVTGGSLNWVQDREQLSINNNLSPESFGLSIEIIFREIERIALFGPRKLDSTPEEVILGLIEDNFSDKPKKPYTEFITSEVGKTIFLREDFIPNELTEFEEFQKRLKGLPPFIFHYGGAGDGLLLLSSAIENMKPAHGALTVVSAATNIVSSEQFFRVFPEVGTLFIVQLPDDPLRLTMLRYSMASVASCRSMGATPLRSHKDDWIPGIDITKSYGIPLYPAWAKNYPAQSLVPKQVTIAPRGSGLHLTGGKSNSIPTVMWEDLIFVIKNSGFTPVVLGTPKDEEEYPIPGGCIDKRSYSFSEQMELIKGSVALVSADSWPKSFSALAGIQTLVFPPTYDGAFGTTEDVGINVFIKPWPNLVQGRSAGDLERFLKTL